MGKGLTLNKTSLIKKLREIRETNNLEIEHEEFEPVFGRTFETNFEIRNEYSENILITDCDFACQIRPSQFS